MPVGLEVLLMLLARGEVFFSDGGDMGGAVTLGDLGSRLVVIALMRLDFPTPQPTRLTPKRGVGGSESALPIPSMVTLGDLGSRLVVIALMRVDFPAPHSVKPMP